MKKLRNNTTNSAIVLHLNRSSWNDREGVFRICPILVPLASVKYISKAEIDGRVKEKPHAPKSWIYFHSDLGYGVIEDICTIERLISEKS